MSVNNVSELTTVESLTRTVLPTLFSDPNAISVFGESLISNDTQERYSHLMEKSYVSALAERIVRIAKALDMADPRKIAKNPSWLARFTGNHLEKKVRYQKARENVDKLINEGKTFMKHVEGLLVALDGLSAEYEREISKLRVYIEAGNVFLLNAPDETKQTELVFDKPRERLARKVANLATLLASHEMSVMHLKLARAQAIDILDRFNETVNIMVPVWRQHTLALITTNSMDPAMISTASQAHKALMTSLHKSLEGIEK